MKKKQEHFLSRISLKIYLISRVEKYNSNVIRSSNQQFWCNNYSLFRIKMLDEILQQNIHIPNIRQLDILFPSNRNIHKSSYGLCIWASDPLNDRFY